MRIKIKLKQNQLREISHLSSVLILPQTIQETAIEGKPAIFFLRDFIFFKWTEYENSKLKHG